MENLTTLSSVHNARFVIEILKWNLTWSQSISMGSTTSTNVDCCLRIDSNSFSLHFTNWSQSRKHDVKNLLKSLIITEILNSIPDVYFFKFHYVRETNWCYKSWVIIWFVSMQVCTVYRLVCSCSWATAKRMNNPCTISLIWMCQSTFWRPFREFFSNRKPGSIP